MSEARGGFRFWRLGEAPLRIIIDPAELAEPDPEADRAWEHERRRNPRLHDGSILSVDRIDATAGVLRCRPARYRDVAAPPAGRAPALLLAVRGLVIAHGPGGREHVLLGRRHPQNRMYGGTWEVVPAGGVAPPAPGVRAMALPDLVAELERERREETSLALPITDAAVVGLALDEAARSLDVVLRCDAGIIADQGPAEGGDSWDVERTHWAPVDQAGVLAAQLGDRLSPMTRAMWEFLGWATPAGARA